VIERLLGVEKDAVTAIVAHVLKDGNSFVGFTF